jgi:hypothetical protein
MSTLTFPAHRLRRSYAGAAEDAWLASTAGKAVIVDSGDVWSVVASQEKSTSKLPTYTLVWLYNSAGQRPEKGGTVSVDASHPNYASFLAELMEQGTVVSLSEGTAFASSQRGSSSTATPSASSASGRTYATQGSRGGKRLPSSAGQAASGAQPTSGSETPFWKNPWFIGGAAVVTVGTGVVAFFALRKKKP